MLTFALRNSAAAGITRNYERQRMMNEKEEQK